MKTVNCILIVRKDLQASNGVVHLVEKILEPFVMVPGKNLAEMIEQVLSKPSLRFLQNIILLTKR